MRVLIVGSLPDNSADDADPEAYRSACREIGAEVAERGWTLSVGTDRTDTADRLVVEGVVASEKPVTINVYYHDNEPLPFNPGSTPSTIPDSHARIVHRHGPGNWISGRIAEIRDADIIILIGGGDKTAQAFHTASVLPKPCLPLPGFGGASAELWPTFTAAISHLALDAGSLRGQVQPWRIQESAKSALDFAKRYVDAKPYARRSTRYLSFVILFVLVAIACWGYLFFGDPSSKQIGLFLILLASSVMGTALHWFLLLISGRDRQLSPAFSWARAGAAVIEAVALFLLLLLGSLSINGDVGLLERLTDNTVYYRLATIGSVFGLAAGFMTESISKSLAHRLSKAAENTVLGPEAGDIK